MTLCYDEWNDAAWQRVMEKAKEDADYQELLVQCQNLTEGYQKILEKLSPEEQEELERYISCCEEMEYRLAQLAYETGKERLLRGKI